MAAQNSLVFTFEVFRGEELLERKELNAESVTIGRGPAAMVRIEDDSLQDLHAVINVNNDGSVQFADLVGNGSTLINGAPVNNGTLHSGDVIGIGAIRVDPSSHLTRYEARRPSWVSLTSAGDRRISELCP